MKPTNTFKTILLVIFGFGILIAVIVFSLNKGGGNKQNYGSVEIWGTLPQNIVNEALKDIEDNITITYKQKQETSLRQELVEALASGYGPNIIMLPFGEFIGYRKHLSPTPYESFSERDFRNAYVAQAELYLTQGGVLALPLLIDPMVMFWNRAIFSSHAVSHVPSVWDDFNILAPTMTIRDDLTISRSTIPFGQYANVSHAKDIISMLIMQAGAPIIAINKGEMKVNVNEGIDIATPGSSAFKFFMAFSNPALSTYSWNRSLPQSKQVFISGQSAVYFGYASEYDEIKKINPHLDFDVAMVPQARGAQKKLTFGKINGLAMLRNSKNKTGSFYAMQLITSGDIAEKLSQGLQLPPAHRDLLAQKPDDATLPVFYDSAHISASWPDLSSKDTDTIFRNAVEGILSSRFSVDEAVEGIERQLSQLVKVFVGE